MASSTATPLNLVLCVQRRTAVNKSNVVIGDPQENDLAEISWSGTMIHVQHIAEELKRVLTGKAEYIAVRNLEGRALSIGLIDHVLSFHSSLFGGYFMDGKERVTNAKTDTKSSRGFLT